MGGLSRYAKRSGVGPGRVCGHPPSRLLRGTRPWSASGKSRGGLDRSGEQRVVDDGREFGGFIGIEFVEKVEVSGAVRVG